MIDLKAKISLIDSMTDPMRRVERQVKSAEKSMKTLSNATSRAERSSDRMGRSFHRAGGGIGSMTKGLGALTAGLAATAGAMAAIDGAKKVFESTVLEAAKFEQSTVIIGAMFDDKKLSKQYTKLVDSFAEKSPLMSSQDMMANSKGLIGMTKDIGQLEKLWSLSERLSSVNPLQGVEGAVYSLRALASGDSLSLADRFDLDPKVLSAIKNLPLEQQISSLDKYLNKMGITQKVINDMGGSTLGLWSQVQEKFQRVLRQMGEPALGTLSNFFNKALDRLGGDDIQRFAQVGARWIDNILTGLTNASIRVYDWFANLTASDEFKSKTTLAAKVNFVIQDVFDNFSKWMKESGKYQMEKATKFLLEVAAVGLSEAQGPLLEAAADVGVAVGKALGSAASKELKSSIDNMLKDFMKVPGLAGVGIGGTIGRSVGDFIQGKDDKKTSDTTEKATPKKKRVNTSNSVIRIQPKLPVRGSFNAGTDRIHSDGLYRLHKDEAVLNRGKADKYRNGGGIGGITIAKLADHIIIREEADIDRITDNLVRKLIAAGEAGA